MARSRLPRVVSKDDFCSSVLDWSIVSQLPILLPRRFSRIEGNEEKLARPLPYPWSDAVAAAELPRFRHSNARFPPDGKGVVPIYGQAGYYAYGYSREQPRS